MKVTYNWLKDFVEIKIPARELADKLTMAGLEVTSLEARDGDFVFEIEVTSNRPDWLSVSGIAREVAAVTGKKLASWPVGQLASSNRQTGRPQGRGLASDGQSHKPVNRLTINIENKKDCPLYTARIIRGVKVAPSPDWLRKRLELVGCRSVNNIVDITNFVLFEQGEPLHAFDLEKLVGQLASWPVGQLEISIRRAQEKEEIVLINGVKHILNNNILVIASDIKTGKPAGHKAVVWPPMAKATNRQTGKPVAIAGIMGGRDAEVSWSTKDILLEAAVFNPILVRRGRQQLGLESESSYRFERGVDPQAPEPASQRAAELIRELAGGECVLAKSAGAGKKQPAVIQLSVSGTKNILGANIPALKIKSILASLGFTVRPKAKNNFSVAAPSFRQDAASAIDLIEEVARIYGYDKIPTTIPKVSPNADVFQTRGMIALIKDVLTGLGLNEVITYSLIDRGALPECVGAGEVIEILNPLSIEQGVLRPTVVPGLLKCVAYNLNQKQDYVNIFEIAKTFRQGPSGPREEWVLAASLCGTKTFFMAERGLAREEAGLSHLKGILEILFERLGIKDFDFLTAAGRGIEVRVQGEKVGLMLEVPRPVLDKFDIKNKDAVALEIYLEKIFSQAKLKKQFMPLPKYPGITRDISLLLKEGVRAADILLAIKEKAGVLLQEAKIADYYKGKQIPAGSKGLTVSCLYRSPERTLTEAEINPLHSAICGLLSEKFEAKIR